MSDPTTEILAYMGEDGAFPRQIRRCPDFAHVATLEAGEEAYGPIFAAAPETAERLRELAEAADNVTASLHGCITTEPMEQALFALRAAVARARGGA